MQEQKSKLYLNMILKEDEPVEMVKRSIDSVREGVDDLYITVTYKTKKPATSPLIKLLESYKANISYFKWVQDFAAARNFAMEQVPHGHDCYIYWQDADDVLVGVEKLHRIADEALMYNHAAVFFQYWYLVDLDEDGNVREILINHKRERIIRNDNTFNWISMLHETLIEQAVENVNKVGRTECHIVHLTDPARLDANIDRNIGILEEQARKEQHRDPRTLIYLAKAYFDKSKMGDAGKRKMYCDLSLVLFHEYLEGWGQPGSPGYQEGSGWAEERATAWSYIGEIAILSHNYPIAAQAFQSAIDEAPQFPLYYLNLATCYVFMNDFTKAKTWLTIATSVDEPDTTIITTPRDLKTRALSCSLQINLHENKLPEAMEDIVQMMEILPGDKELEEQYKVINSLNAANKASQSVVYLGKYLEAIKEQDKIQYLLKAIPQDLAQEKFASEMRHMFTPARKWQSNEIALLCGPGFEEWTPDSVETGLGGSEEAVVYLSQELKKKGWKVTVYANPGAKAGDFDGVEYKMWHDMNTRDEFNVLILWRQIGFVDFNPKAKFTMVWMHDVPNNPDFTEERVNKVDKIALLSEFHRSLLRMMDKKGNFVEMPEEKVFLTSNGVTGLEPHEPWDGNPHRMIYSSSYDRGLPYLLINWDKIRAAVPDAELHVFYGWDLFDKVHSNNPGKQKWKAMVDGMMKQPGITHHGRVGHKELAEEMAKSGIWAYPTDFEEISCITAMKQQLMGAVPVVTNYAALQETVKNGIKVDVDIKTENGQKEYVEALIGLLNSPEAQEEIRTPMMAWAKKYFGWDIVASNWDQLFRIKLQNPEIPVIEASKEA